MDGRTTVSKSLLGEIAQAILGLTPVATEEDVVEETPLE